MYIDVVLRRVFAIPDQALAFAPNKLSKLCQPTRYQRKQLQVNPVVTLTEKRYPPDFGAGLLEAPFPRCSARNSDPTDSSTIGIKFAST